MIQRIKSRLLRARISPIATGFLTVLWCLMWGDFSLGNLVNGVILAAIIALVFPMPHVSRETSLRPLAVLWLVVVFIRDLFWASLQVSWQVVRPRGVRTSALVRVRLRARSDLLLTMTTDLFSLIPGSLIVEVERDRGVVLVHALGAESEADFRAVRESLLRQEDRVLRAFAPTRELRALGLIKPRPQSGAPASGGESTTGGGA
ncbi:Na+/H+ antiporter subunit E [Micrococcales bacterium 31B]|nr:Na+/H+ antiporter subunit E [Micrococcales bacterium 31B]